MPPVIIDIKPGDALNEIRLKSAKTVDVAILSSAVFDARTVDANSLRFGRTGAEDSLTRHKKTGAPQVSFRDVNGDGRLDLVARFVVADTGFRAGDTKGILTGRLANGPAFTDDDAVTMRN